MIRGIIGDVIGSYFEGVQWTNKEGSLFDLNHPVNYILPEPVEKRTGQSITDDSLCTLALYQAFVEGKKGIEAAKILSDICSRHLNIGFGKSFIQWISDLKPYQSYANGAIMRLGFLHMVPKEERLSIAIDYTLISHDHEDSLAAVTDYVYILNNLGNKDVLDELITKRNITKSVEDYHDDKAFLISAKDTLNQAIVVLKESNSFEDVLRNSLYIGGDSDTLACVACSLTDYEVPEYLISFAKNEVKKFSFEI